MLSNSVNCDLSVKRINQRILPRLNIGTDSFISVWTINWVNQTSKLLQSFNFSKSEVFLDCSVYDSEGESSCLDNSVQSLFIRLIGIDLNFNFRRWLIKGYFPYWQWSYQQWYAWHWSLNCFPEWPSFLPLGWQHQQQRQQRQRQRAAVAVDVSVLQTTRMITTTTFEMNT